MAAEFLKKHGLEILDRNYCIRGGEIDIIARDRDYLVFVEVKFRSTSLSGTSAEAIDGKKASRIRHAAAVYLYTRGYPETTPCRFDAVAIDRDRITWVKDAF